jgi:glycosyltransferase involved in cell wall biosynthesis/SAM-dependent methyltransferase
MNVVFVNYHDFTSNSAIHISNLANELSGSGAGCAVVVPGDPATVELLGEHRYLALDYRAAGNGGLRFPDGKGPTLVHAWTPREGVRLLTEQLAGRYGCPYFVHLEDNEDVVTAERLGLTVAELHAAPRAELDASVAGALSHPTRMRRFLGSASGITAIVDRLLEFQPDGVPAEVVWPAFEPEIFTPDPGEPELRRRLGIADGDAVIVYPGNAHSSNAAEVRSLYLAVAAVNRAGRRLKLVRLGRDFVRLFEPELAEIRRHVVHVPLQPRAEVGRYLRLADVLVQPGRVDAFNEYRFPSKLPEFLATGRPVVLPAANVGRFLEDGRECVLLEHGDALEIAAVVERLLDDDVLRATLGRGARAFAERSFSWEASAVKLRSFYDRVLSRGPRRPEVPDERLEELRRRQAGAVPPRLGYATVKDYCDSADRLPLLATASLDMKDVQRPWMLKAVVGAVPSGSRLLEIGAGEPIVADLLARLGYEVTVIDPYDGRDRGPTGVDEIGAAYPRVRFVQGLFPGDLPVGETFDCIYSISVLEHVSLDALEEVCRASLELLRPGGHTIHAVDHVQRGPGEDEHLEHLTGMARGFGVNDAELDELLGRLVDDPETYFLSAESHNRWRGATRYDEFPMRRCVSIELCLPAAER